MNKNKHDQAYMDMAIRWSKQSYCKRKQVGCIVVKDNMIISDGYNGRLSGEENKCEEHHHTTGLITRSDVIHAEMNAILKCAKSTHSIVGSTFYCTLAPCISCAIALLQCNIKRLVYHEVYRSIEGIEKLKQKIIVDQL